MVGAVVGAIGVRDVGVEVDATTSTAVGDGDGALVDGEMAVADVGTGFGATVAAAVGVTVCGCVVDTLVGGALVAFVAACGVAHAPTVDAMRNAAISRRMFRD